MKKYAKECIITVIQLLLFYILPLFAGPTDAMGVVFLLILSVLILSFALGILSGSKVKFLYPLAIAVLFIPSVFIYYNATALVHALWYFVLALAGVGVGSLIGRLFVRNQ